MWYVVWYVKYNVYNGGKKASSRGLVVNAEDS